MINLLIYVDVFMLFLIKVFTGNEDRGTAVLHFFTVPLVTRYLRFQPQSWKNKICMRIEIYGCALSKFVASWGLCF